MIYGRLFNKGSRSYIRYTQRLLNNLRYTHLIIKSNRNQNVFTIFRLNWNQTDVRSVLNQLKMVNTF